MLWLDDDAFISVDVTEQSGSTRTADTDLTDTTEDSNSENRGNLDSMTTDLVTIQGEESADSLMTSSSCENDRHAMLNVPVHVSSFIFFKNLCTCFAVACSGINYFGSRVLTFLHEFSMD